MIDFRYHLVSIVAVFLSLAIGVVVGAAALQGPAFDRLSAANSGLISDKRALESQVRELRSDVSAADSFARAVSPQVVGDALAGQRVLLVLTPDTPAGLVDGLTPVITEAGGTVVGRLQIRNELLEPEQNALVEDIVAAVVPAGLDLPEGRGVDRAAVQLAAALSGSDAAPAVDDAAADTVVSAFEEADLVELDEAGDTRQVATLVVVLTGSEPDEETTEAVQQERQRGLLSIAGAFGGRAEAAVVAGPSESALDGGLLSAVRGDSDLADEVSTVDDVDRAHGQLGVVLALREQNAGRGTGAYGSAPGATSVVPTPAAP